MVVVNIKAWGIVLYVADYGYLFKTPSTVFFKTQSTDPRFKKNRFIDTSHVIYTLRGCHYSWGRTVRIGLLSTRDQHRYEQ